MTAPPFSLRHAVVSDIDPVLTLERATGGAPHWPRTAYSAILDATAVPRCLIVAYAIQQPDKQPDRTLAGFAVGRMHPAPAPGDSTGQIAGADQIAEIGQTAELESIVVAAEARRVGIGRALCCAVLDWLQSQGATEVTLEVRAANATALALYTGLGFVQTGRRPRYYHDPPDDALLLSLRSRPPGQHTGKPATGLVLPSNRQDIASESGFAR